MTSQRILITGSRDWTDLQTMKDTFNQYFVENPFDEPPTLVSGSCPRGADHLAEQLFLSKGFCIERHPADWFSFGKAAGFIRNQEMVDSLPDVCFAFILNNSKGATHCSKAAQKAEIHTIIVHQRAN